MKNKSVWENEVNISTSKKTKNKLPQETDILIIGGGITGLTTAYLLKDINKKIILIDKSEVAHGISSKTTAKISYMQGTVYQKIEKNFDKKTSKKYLDSQLEAIKIIKDIINKNNILCDLENSDSILFTTEEKGISKVKKEQSLLKEWKIKTKAVKHSKIKYGFKTENNYTFNPLKYLESIQKIITKKIEIYENITENLIKKENNLYHVKTNTETIKAKTVIVACHYPFFILPILIPLKTYINREYVNTIKTDNPYNYNAINIDKKLHSIRFYKDNLIYTSNQHNLTNKINYQQNYKQSIEDTQKYFGNSPEYTWMNQDIMSHDNIPFIGKIDENLYLATAYNAWGMTNGTIAAKVISDLIIENKSPYEDLFNPKRRNLSLIINSLIGTLSYLKVYAQTIFQKNNPKYIKIKGLTYAIYKDKNNKKHIINLLCPHMKCNLVFNKEEETWDCPCHGSRFDMDGKLLEGPATKNIDKNIE